jgi:hypothetical protein
VQNRDDAYVTGSTEVGRSAQSPFRVALAAHNCIRRMRFGGAVKGKPLLLLELKSVLLLDKVTRESVASWLASWLLPRRGQRRSGRGR